MGTIQQTGIDEPTWPATATTWDAVREFHLGLNGIGGLTTSNDERDVLEWAGFAVCSSWCGAYPAPGER